MMFSSSPVEGGRKNELKVAIRKDTLKLFSQIEQGLRIEVRVQPPAKDSPTDDATKIQFVKLRDLSLHMQFPQITGEPILLTSGDPEEGIDNLEEHPTGDNAPKPAAKKPKPKDA